ncbi:ribulose-phosphate 3-epimerase [Gemmiger formicilis]|uniref:ribulose-phosphate 3-epimerase n=1 Tax=Gemmiger formicilis TaxID=745368 RepID=UPI00195C91A9|nr:ribulose-phosphate 3-epimerase [Gemmiger formicilis]MBM6916164.1 ribulose-phosphate 3-epimerase [Gemmiger formicilis]
MAMVSPSLLAADFACLGTECRKVLDAGAQWLHFDVMDGCFVPNISFGVPVLAGLRKALPDAFFDVHLMIRDPLAYIEPFAKAGASLITFHLESDSDVGATLAAIKAAGCKAGISIKPATPVSALEPWLDQLDLVLVMSVEPGFGGQSFMPGALDKLSALAQEKRRRGLPFLLEVDGGVDEASGTAAACVNAGAEVLVAGSAVFRAADPAAAVAGLLRL